MEPTRAISLVRGNSGEGDRTLSGPPQPDENHVNRERTPDVVRDRTLAEDDSAAPLLRTKIRIESLSDLVFGLALSIGCVFLIGRVPQTGQDLAANILLFGFSFLILVMTWVGYSRTMAVLPVEVPLALLLNLSSSSASLSNH